MAITTRLGFRIERRDVRSCRDLRSSSPNSPATRFSRLATSPDICGACRQHFADGRERRAAFIRVRRAAASGMAASAASRSSSSMKNCSRTSILNSASVSRAPLVGLREAAAAPRGRARPPCRAPIRHRAAPRMPASRRPPSPILDFSSAMRACEQLAVLGGHLAACATARTCGSTPTAACSAGEP